MNVINSESFLIISTALGSGGSVISISLHVDDATAATAAKILGWNGEEIVAEETKEQLTEQGGGVGDRFY